MNTAHKHSPIVFLYIIYFLLKRPLCQIELLVYHEHCAQTQSNYLSSSRYCCMCTCCLKVISLYHVIWELRVILTLKRIAGEVILVSYDILHFYSPQIQFASVHQVQQSIQGEKEMSERVEDEIIAGKPEYTLEGELWYFCRYKRS